MLNNDHLHHGHGKSDIAERISARKSGDFLRDTVFGGIDGTVTTFAIISGVSGAGMSHGVILVLGIANLLADGFSMAVGNYSATKSDLEKLEYLIDVENNHLEHYRAGEVDELRQILAGYGFKGSKLNDATETINSSQRLWVDLMLLGEYGLSSLRPNPTAAAMATFVAFVACGSVPLVPFLLRMENAIVVSSIATALVFFLVGAVKTMWTRRPWWRSGFETLLIGSSAALIAYSCGYFLSGLIT